MATSGSVDFSVNRDEIITEALELLHVLKEGASPGANDLTTCSRSLNLMIKSWMAEGVPVWKVSEGTLTLVASQQSYVMGTGEEVNIDKPLRIIEMRRRDSSNIDTPMFEMTRDEYMRLSSKTLATIPTQYYFQPGIDTSTLYIWPTASSTTAANDSIKFSYYSLIEDFDAAANTPDFPVEWSEALAYNLAVRIAPKYDKPISDIPTVVALAGELKETMISWAQEDGSVFFGVEM